MIQTHELLVLSAWLVIFSCCVAGSKSPDFPTCNVGEVTVSGLSSGGYMAVQYHMARSSLVNGSIVFAGGPWYCAESSLEVAETRCMKHYGSKVVTDELITIALDASIVGTIDHVDNLKHHKTYLFSGTKDSVIDSSVMVALFDFYSAFIPLTNIDTNFDVPAEHCLPTVDYGEPCEELSSPYLGKCGFDGAGDGLKAVMGDYLDLKRTIALDENIIRFDQTKFFIDPLSGIADFGYVYMPTACQDGITKCHLHISFHGCQQNYDYVGLDYIKHGGFNEWAEGSNIIIIYPQTKTTELPLNPNGCWDWWGYTNDLYGLKTGVQIEFITSIISSIRNKYA
jgi:hypothetical protein